MITAIILAAGKGSRMKSEEKKQFMMLNGHRVIYYSLAAFAESKVDRIVLVSSKEDEELCVEAAKDAGVLEMTSIVEGGENRYNSVYNGLVEAAGSDYVLIHDGARPAVTSRLISRSIEEVKKKSAVIVGVKVKDTVTVTDQKGIINDTPDRDSIWLAQTPQAFDYKLLLEAYNSGKFTDMTDETRVMFEYHGIRSLGENSQRF